MVEELRTKYGANIPKELLVEYFERITNRIFVLLPMKESKCDTLEEHLKYMSAELAGGNEILYKDILFLDLLANLEAVNLFLDDFPSYRSQVLKCTNLCRKIINKIEKDVGDDGI